MLLLWCFMFPPFPEVPSQHARTTLSFPYMFPEVEQRREQRAVRKSGKATVSAVASPGDSGHLSDPKLLAAPTSSEAGVGVRAIAAWSGASTVECAARESSATEQPHLPPSKGGHGKRAPSPAKPQKPNQELGEPSDEEIPEGVA